MDHYYIGIDMGTSAIKAVLIDNTCSILHSEEEEYQLSCPHPGWKEIDPELWYKAAVRALGRLLAEIDRSQVSCIGITGQMHTLTVLDSRGLPVRPAMQWNDARTEQMLPHLREQLRKFKNAPYLARIISTGSPAVNLLWLREYEPEHFARIEKFLIGPDYLVYRFCGNCSTDFCEASTSSLYDLYHLRWSEEMRDLVGLRGSQYPHVRGSAQAAGRIRPELAQNLGLPETVRILVGTGDNPAAAISTGCLTGGYPVLSLGTSGVLISTRSKIDFQAKGKNILYSTDGKDIYPMVQGVIQSGGGTLSWWTREILEDGDFSFLDHQLALDKGSNDQLLFYPHIAGEKTIHRDLDIRGAFLGLSGGTTRNDMSRAVMEGICFAFRELIEAMKVTWQTGEKVKITGGGSKSRVWLQLFADILNADVEQMECTGGAAYGAALLAMHASHQDLSLQQLAQHSVKIRAVFHPQVEKTKWYNQQYQRYLRIYPALREIWH